MSKIKRRSKNRRSRNKNRNSGIQGRCNGKKVQMAPQDGSVVEMNSPTTPEKTLATNQTIDLIASDDENVDKLSDISNTNLTEKVGQHEPTSNAVVDMCEASTASDDIIIEHISPATNNTIEIDEDVQFIPENNVEKENSDEIMILHANCKKVEEIEFIGQKINTDLNATPKWKEKKRKRLMEPSSPVINLIGNCSKKQKPDYFNAPVANPYNNRRKKKSKGVASKRNIENLTIKRKFERNKIPLDNLTPKAKVRAIGENVYSENPVSLPKHGLRPVIIDGSNVAFSHSRNRRIFSCRGLEICINFFKEKGHKVTTFVPQFRVKGDKCDNPKLLEKLVNQGDVILTPSRMVDGKAMNSYDDRYIVQFAAVKGGVIVTRDNYNDLLAENPAWEETIKYRILQYTWADDLLMFPNDPLGLRGPTLEKFLKFS